MSAPCPVLDDVLDVVRCNVSEIEGGRRLPANVVGALRASGLHRALVPTALGGTEVVCGDRGRDERLRRLPPQHAAQEVFADPDQGNATMFAPSGSVEGAVLRRRWAFTSNCLHSRWAGLGSLVHTADGAVEPAPRMVFVPVADLVIEDTWASAGLRGTGSHHVRADDVPVELDRSSRFGDAAWPDGAMWRLPIYTVLIPVLSAVPLGIARGAVDAVLALARDGRPVRRGELADDAVGMAELAVADTTLRAADALRHSLDEALDLAQRGDPIGRPLQARILLAALHGCDVAVTATSTAHALGGAAAVFDGSALLRALLDVQAARQHALFGHAHRGPLAAAVAGRDVRYPPFLV